MSLDVIDIDTSHIDGLDELRRQLSGGAEKNEDEGEEEEAEVMAVFAKTAPAIVAPDLPEKPVQVHGYTAEEIALRRFMTTVAWGTGMHVLKHNRGKGRVRRVLRFNDDVSGNKCIHFSVYVRVYVLYCSCVYDITVLLLLTTLLCTGVPVSIGDQCQKCKGQPNQRVPDLRDSAVG